MTSDTKAPWTRDDIAEKMRDLDFCLLSVADKDIAKGKTAPRKDAPRKSRTPSDSIAPSDQPSAKDPATGHGGGFSQRRAKGDRER